MAADWQSQPNPARIHYALLGGKDTYECDRDLADLIRKAFPTASRAACACRAFGLRAAEFAAASRITQFLDVGPGFEPSLHTTARTHEPDARIVYVDNDPLVCAHGRALCNSEGPVDWIEADIGDTDEPAKIVRTLVEALAPGSFLIICHAAATPDVPGNPIEAVADLYQRHSIPYAVRGHDEITSWFDGLELLEPVAAPCSWAQPDDKENWPEHEICALAGVAIKH
jgi:hypothetical protein